MELGAFRHRKQILKRALKNPIGFVRLIGRIRYRRLQLRLNGIYLEPNKRLHPEYNWDVCAILDACRYDMLQRENTFDSECHEHTSQAPSTGIWFYKNFVTAPDELLEDIVYVSANPQASSRVIDTSRFAHFEEVFKYGWSEDIETVPDDRGTVPADVVTDVAVSLHKQYPGKRMLIHYLQPHNPFVQVDGCVPESVGLAYGGLESGTVSLEDVQTAEYCNTRYVLGEVDRLVDYVNGDVVVTSDHGNGWGEGGIYGHPSWAYAEPTLRVPWIELEGRDQDPPDDLEVPNAEQGGDYDSEQQLADLGYR